MKTLRLCLLLILLSSPLLFSQWASQSSLTTLHLLDVQFVGKQNGWVVGNNWGEARGTLRSTYNTEFMRTTDAGATWLKKSLPGLAVWKLHFQSPTLGWAVGETDGRRSLIMKTSDGGSSWVIQDSSNQGMYFASVRFVDPLNGWAVGAPGYPSHDSIGAIYRTTNGGSTWVAVNNPNIANPNDIFFVDAQRGYAVGYSGAIIRSTDGGDTWNEVARAFVSFPTGPMNEPLRRIFFVDRDHGWAVGGISGVETKMRTSDGGLTWLTDNISMGGSSLHGVWFTDVNNGWTVGGGVGGLVIKRTSDGGVTWTKQPVPWTNGYFNGVCMTGGNEGWVVGDFGRVLKTMNGGVTSMGEGESNVPREFALNQNYPNPFNPSTAISYQLPALSVVTLKVFDVLGREVIALVDGVVEPGKYTVVWDGRNSRGDQQSSGIYFYALSTSEHSITKTMVLVK